MRVDVRKWATYSSPGSFFAEETRREVPLEATPETVAVMAKSYEFAFTLELVTRRSADVEGHNLSSEERQPIGGRYFIGGTIFTADQLTAPGDRRLLSNMRANGWSRVIRCRTGNWQPFDPEKDQNITL
jgi:hypothetical protein